MNELTILLIGFTLGCIAGWKFHEYGLRKAVEKMHMRAQAAAAEVLAAQVNIRFVKEHGMIYVFNDDTGEFLVQGQDRDTLIDRLNERFPDKIFIASKDQLVAMELDK